MKHTHHIFILLLLATALAVIIASCNKDNPVSPGFTSMEQSVHQQINAHRTSIGLSALTLNETISAQARQHSQDMADGKSPFGHDGFQDRVNTISQTIALSTAGENVALDSNVTDPATTAVDGWLNSPPHKANIEGDFNLTGIGIAQSSGGTFYFTQIFVKSK